MNRRGFFATLAGAIAARFAPKTRIGWLRRPELAVSYAKMWRDRDFAREFAVSGTKIGETITLKRPARFQYRAFIES